MIDTVVPTAFIGVITAFGIEGVDEDNEAADEAIGPGREEAGDGLLSFLADNCRRVFTTIRSVLHSVIPRQNEGNVAHPKSGSFPWQS
jgi:hypothetical protein